VPARCFCDLLNPFFLSQNDRITQIEYAEGGRFIGQHVNDSGRDVFNVSSANPRAMGWVAAFDRSIESGPRGFDKHRNCMEKNLVQVGMNAILSPTMNRKLLPWLLALAVVTLFLNSCASDEGVAPATGELSRRNPGLGTPGY
jgi:hypothetical protein